MLCDYFNEQYCAILVPPAACSSDEFTCAKTGDCIAKSKLCDGTNDCPKGDDEQQRCSKYGYDGDTSICASERQEYTPASHSKLNLVIQLSID